VSTSAAVTDPTVRLGQRLYFAALRRNVRDRPSSYSLQTLPRKRAHRRFFDIAIFRSGFKWIATAIDLETMKFSPV
jgi:hypothetical protein